MVSWRFLDTGCADGATNMSIDEALLAGVESGSSPPTVRVYAWEPATVSIGHAQDTSSELDVDKCALLGYGVVRRPTGGRAVLHAGELTYSVVGPSGRAPLGGSIAETYCAIARALLAGIAMMGVEAELAPAETTPRPRRGASPPCFASAGRFEIVVDGKKLVGSAQRRSGASVLQHGSLLLDASHAGLADVVRLPTEAERASMKQTLADRTTDLSSLLGRAVGFVEAAQAVRLGFERAWGIALEAGELTEVEKAAAAALATDR